MEKQEEQHSRLEQKMERAKSILRTSVKDLRIQLSNKQNETIKYQEMLNKRTSLSIKKESDVNADNSSSDKKPIIRARRTYKRSVNNKDQSVNDDKNTSNNK
ncbi:1190_t:CDS:2, partial [Entrophospora sp. SA101]